MEATIQIQGVYPPKEGSRSPYWSIKDSRNEWWSCAKEVAQYAKDMKAQGADIVVVYDTKDYNGKTYKNIKSASASAQPASQPARPAQAAERYDEAQKAEDIFISGAINHAIAAGQLAVPEANVQAWTRFLMALRTAWRASKAPPSVASTAAAMRSPEQYDEPPPFA